jgi:hypothetical protein
MQDFSLPGMLHGRVIRPASSGASLVSVDESSIKHLSGVELVRIKDFLGLVGEDEWTVIKAIRALKCQWSGAATLPPQADVPSLMRAGPFTRDEKISGKARRSGHSCRRQDREATYYWPMQSHASMGRPPRSPTCAPTVRRSGPPAGLAPVAASWRAVQPVGRKDPRSLSGRRRVLRHERSRRCGG